MKLAFLLSTLVVAFAIVVNETVAEALSEERLDALWANHKVSLAFLKIIRHNLNIIHTTAIDYIYRKNMERSIAQVRMRNEKPFFCKHTPTLKSIIKAMRHGLWGTINSLTWYNLLLLLLFCIYNAHFPKTSSAALLCYYADHC